MVIPTFAYGRDVLADGKSQRRDVSDAFQEGIRNDVTKSGGTISPVTERIQHTMKRKQVLCHRPRRKRGIS